MGGVIPECWHDQLDNIPANVLESQEWVGYKCPDGTIMYVQILHEINLHNGDHSVNGTQTIEHTYLVATGEERPIGAKSSELYKMFKNEMISSQEKELSIPIPKRDPNEAKWWMKQAEHDCVALCALKNATKFDEKISAATCFMSHKVAVRCRKDI